MTFHACLLLKVQIDVMIFPPFPGRVLKEDFEDAYARLGLLIHDEQLFVELVTDSWSLSHNGDEGIGGTISGRDAEAKAQ